MHACHQLKSVDILKPCSQNTVVNIHSVDPLIFAIIDVSIM
jgi:hypothetical protein